MEKSGFKYLFFLLALCLFGSGCVEQPPLLKAAEPFIAKETPPATKQGFGKLPTIQYPRCTAKVTLSGDFPKLPDTITVLKVKRGSPNDTELQNIAAAISIPQSVIGDQQADRDLTLNWKDAKGVSWTYVASKKLLTFTTEKNVNKTITVSKLPENEKITLVASDFLRDMAFDLTDFAEAQVVPDWNEWQAKSETGKKCLDARGLAVLKDALKKLTPFTINLPDLASKNNSRCVDFEYPAEQIVRYAKKTDGRMIIKKNGNPVYGIELAVDMTTGAVTEGRIELPSEPEKSDYPALTKPLVDDLLNQCGLSGASGELNLNKFDYEYLLYEDTKDDSGKTLLIPSLVASGIRKQENGETEDYKVVVPLIERQ
ncbi:MAG: hypothetical protein ABIB04_03720 [Patescibacteria group bacterium]